MCFRGPVMRKFVFLFILLFPFSAFAKMMDVAHFKLDNGLNVLVVENHKAPVVLQMIYYKTGSLYDPKGKGGIAHLLEHMMFRGTKNVSSQDFESLLTKHGVQNNAYTTYNETAYHEFSDISVLELMMALEADRMQNLLINDKAFVKERDVVLQERFQRFETQSAPLFYETLNKILWQDHARANPVSGSVEEIKNLTKDDAIVFYRQWYRPDNAILVLAGDINVTEAKLLTQKYYGKIKAEGEMPKITPPPAPRVSDTTMVMALESVEQPRYVSYMRLDVGALDDQDMAALSILEEYLTGDDTSYLYNRLVYETKQLLAVNVGIDYDKDMGGVAAVYVVPADLTMSPEKIKTMVDDEIDKGLKLLDSDKLEKVKSQILSSVIYLQENPISAARFVGEMFLAGYSAEEISRYDETLQAVSLDDIHKVWQKIMAYKVRLTGYLKGKENKAE